MLKELKVGQLVEVKPDPEVYGAIGFVKRIREPTENGRPILLHILAWKDGRKDKSDIIDNESVNFPFDYYPESLKSYEENR